MKLLFFFISLSIFPFIVFGQTSLIKIGNQESLYITAQNILTIDGLVIEPTTNKTINNNGLSSYSNNLPSIKGVLPLIYQWDKPFANLKGVISWNYTSLGLNSEQQSKLVVFVYDTQWVSKK